LEWIIRNWTFYEPALKEEIRDFVEIIMVKIFRVTYVHKDEYEYTPAAARQPFNVYELLYPNITVIIEKLRNKLKMNSII
jgi:hypothetical protein